MMLLAMALLMAGSSEPALAGSENVTRSPSAAEARFLDGLKAYDDHDYQRAIEAFEAAYRDSAKPEILFNIAQTHRVLGSCQRAVESFDAFLAAVPADHPLAPRARSRREEISPCSPVVGVAPDAKPPQPSPSPPSLAATSPIVRAPERPPTEVLLKAPPPARSSLPSPALRATCIGTVGASVVLAGLGVGFGLWARSVQGSVENTEVWDAAAERADARGEFLDRSATTLLLAAGVTTTIAATTCLLSRRRGN